MMRWFLFVLALTAGTVFYQHPTVYQEIKERAPVWLGMQENSTLYRWQNADGNWQIGAHPPASGITYETITIGHDRQKVYFTQK